MSHPRCCVKMCSQSEYMLMLLHGMTVQSMCEYVCERARVRVCARVSDAFAMCMYSMSCSNNMCLCWMLDPSGMAKNGATIFGAITTMLRGHGYCEWAPQVQAPGQAA